MKKLTEWIKGYALVYARDYLKKNKASVVRKLNKKIDLPLLDEKKEADLMSAIYDVLLEAFEDKKK
tara:strand:+ start:1897 stop:2094 length:198 start_codon:yes stop_codon:yes gene_type:complete